MSKTAVELGDTQVAIKIGGRVFVMSAAEIVSGKIEVLNQPYDLEEGDPYLRYQEPTDYLITVQLHGRSMSVFQVDQAGPNEVRVIGEQEVRRLKDGRARESEL
jgi:hypothetical protein